MRINYDKHLDNSREVMKYLVDYLKDEEKIRVTEQRENICKVLAIAQAHKHHPTAEEINAYAIGSDKSNSTTYRTLIILIEAGLVDILDFRDGRIRYEVKPNVPHGHLINRDTGEVTEFEISPVMAKELAKVNNSGLGMKEIHIVVHVDKEERGFFKKQRV